MDSKQSEQCRSYISEKGGHFFGGSSSSRSTQNDETSDRSSFSTGDSSDGQGTGAGTDRSMPTEGFETFALRNRFKDFELSPNIYEGVDLRSSSINNNDSNSNSNSSSSHDNGDNTLLFGSQNSGSNIGNDALFY